MNTERFHNIEDIIGYTFRDLDLLVTALTHKSYANERKINKVESYERSEFLGDAILEFVGISGRKINKAPSKSGM